MTDKNQWGNTDVFADVPKHLQPKVTFDGSSADVIAANVITVPAHSFVNGDKVKYTSTAAATNLANDTDYFVVDRTADTFKLEASVGNGAIVLTNDGAAADGLQKVATDCFFVDTDEAGVVASEGLGNSGWNLYTSRTVSDGAGGTYTRHSSECLVAMGVNAATAGDAEDTVTVDSTMSISAQPTAAAITEGATAVIDVTATSNNPDAAFSFVWSYDPAGGTSYVPVTTTTHPDFAVDADGTLTFSTALDATSPHPMNGDTFRVVVTATFPGGATASATSNAVALTVNDA